MAKETFTAWRKRIDRLAEKAALVEPGASFTRRHDRTDWRELYDADLSAEAAWETYMEEDELPQ